MDWFQRNRKRDSLNALGILVIALLSSVACVVLLSWLAAAMK